jgi:hypothetical protein
MRRSHPAPWHPPSRCCLACCCIDWIELIPFNETRNYVQRVLENVVIYQTRRGETTPTLLAQWKQ